jgi:hypothetical protein
MALVQLYVSTSQLGYPTILSMNDVLLVAIEICMEVIHSHRGRDLIYLLHLHLIVILTQHSIQYEICFTETVHSFH